MDEETLARLLSDPPEFLYKYRSFQEDKDKKRVKEIITDSKLYFSSPTELNDPFDCKLDKNYLRPNTKKETKKLLYGALKKGNRKERRKKVGNLIKNTPENIKSEIHDNTDVYQEIINNSRSFSLAKSKKNVLLWSHYADGHKGLCLEFAYSFLGKSISQKNSTSTSSGWAIFPITYTDERPQGGTIMGDMMKEMTDIFFTKAEGWEYEQEWRISYIPLSAEGMKVGCGLKVFPKESLVGIIFGCEMPDKHKKEIVELVNEHRPTLKLQQAKIAPGKFALTIKPYEH